MIGNDLPRLTQYITSSIVEGGEELWQGIVSRLAGKGLYQQSAPWASMTEEDAVLNPSVMVREVGGGIAVGAILGGAQAGFVAAVDAIAQKRAQVAQGSVSDASDDEMLAPADKPVAAETVPQMDDDAMTRGILMLADTSTMNSPTTKMEALAAVFSAGRADEGALATAKAAAMRLADWLGIDCAIELAGKILVEAKKNGISLDSAGSAITVASLSEDDASAALQTKRRAPGARCAKGPTRNSSAAWTSASA